MNLRYHKMLNAHSDRIEDLFNIIMDELAKKPQDKFVPDPFEMLRQIIKQSGIHDVVLPIETLGVGPDIPIGTVAREVHYEYQALIGKRIELNDDPETPLPDWMARAIWPLERAQRGETGDMVTMGCGPFTKRALAVLGHSLVVDGVAPTEMNLERDHVDALRNLSPQKEAMLASDFLSHCVRTLDYGSDKYLDQNEWNQIFEVDSETGSSTGYPLEYEVTVNNGVMECSVSIEHGQKRIKIDDDRAVFPITMPETVLAESIGKKIDIIYDHPLVKGLPMVIERYFANTDNTVISFKPWKAKGIKVHGFAEE